MSVLTVKKLGINFGGLKAVDDFNIEYPKFYEKTIHAINFISFDKDVKIDKTDIKRIKKLGFKIY